MLSTTTELMKGFPAPAAATRSGCSRRRQSRRKRRTEQCSGDSSRFTAMTRKVIPLPTRHLLQAGRLTGRILDYGCGHCHEVNNRSFVADGWDPNFRNIPPSHRAYDTIICNYVLNVLWNPEDQEKVLSGIHNLLDPLGKSYISVRRDVHKARISQRGTYQGRVYLPFAVEETNSNFCIYRVTKDELLQSCMTQE